MVVELAQVRGARRRCAPGAAGRPRSARPARRPRVCARRRRRSPGAPAATPASARAAIARPFQAVTTLSSRAGRGPPARGPRRGARRASASSGPASWPTSRDTAVHRGRDVQDRRPLEVALGGARRSAGSPPAPARASAARASSAGVQTKKAPSPPGESASCATAKPPSGQPHLAQQVVERLLGDPAVPGAARQRGGPARSRAPAGRCRRASSRSGAPASGRRRCSGGSRRRPGRRCRRAAIASERQLHHLARVVVVGPAPEAAQQELERQRGRELGRAAEAALDRVEDAGEARRPRRPGSARRASSRRGGARRGGGEPARHLGRLALHVVAAVAVGPGDRPAEVGEGRQAAARGAAGSRCRRRTGRPSGVRKTVIGQPPWPASDRVACM